MPPLRYARRQWGTILYVIVGLLMTPLVIFQVLEGNWAVASVILATVGLTLLLFGSLLVTVDAEQVRLSFGVGVIQRRIPLSQVLDSKPVQNRMWWGYGIRLTPHGWMWNIAGLQAVELTLASGRHFRIGTGEPEALNNAIASAKAG
ncbi:MAG: hypothetical protein AAGA48_34440 [Myxococcota bacterium]